MYRRNNYFRIFQFPVLLDPSLSINPFSWIAFRYLSIVRLLLSIEMASFDAVNWGFSSILLIFFPQHHLCRHLYRHLYRHFLSQRHLSLDMPKQKVYEVYYELWRIEGCFRVMESYLEARPVYLQKEDSIYGHFTICYLTLTILRFLEIKAFEDKILLGKLLEFIR